MNTMDFSVLKMERTRELVFKLLGLNRAVAVDCHADLTDLTEWH